MVKILAKAPPGLVTQFPITQAVVDRSQDGCIYGLGDDVFVIHKSGFCSYVGELNSVERFLFLINSQKVPNYIHIYDPCQKMVDVFSEHPGTYATRLRKRISLIYNKKVAINLLHHEGFSLKYVDEQCLGSLSVFNLNLDHKFWSSSQDFIQNSYATIVLNSQEEPVSICYSAASALGRAEIDVYTVEMCRGLGLAKLAVSGFINRCLDAGIVPNWDCFEDNQPSLKTAMGLGFKVVKEYSFLSIFKNK
jgi:hypothetical protein